MIWLCLPPVHSHHYFGLMRILTLKRLFLSAIAVGEPVAQLDEARQSVVEVGDPLVGNQAVVSRGFSRQWVSTTERRKVRARSKDWPHVG
jgi:hypothetical protein